MLPWLNLGLPQATSSAQTDRAPNLSSYLARLIASGQATSRSELARITGLARSTVSEHLAPLLRIDLIAEREAQATLRGRPPSVLTLNPRAGVILVADLGASRGRLAPSAVRARSSRTSSCRCLRSIRSMHAPCA